MTVCRIRMDETSTVTWDAIFPPLPAGKSSGPPPTINYSSQRTALVPCVSLTEGTNSLTNLPDPLQAPTMVANAPRNLAMTSRIDPRFLNGQLSGLYAAFSADHVAREALQVIASLVQNGIPPNNSLLNTLILYDVNKFRCSVSTCKRYVKGSGWSRLDRARWHLRTEHLGNYFPCTVMGW